MQLTERSAGRLLSFLVLGNDLCDYEGVTTPNRIVGKRKLVEGGLLLLVVPTSKRLHNVREVTGAGAAWELGAAVPPPVFQAAGAGHAASSVFLPFELIQGGVLVSFFIYSFYFLFCSDEINRLARSGQTFAGLFTSLLAGERNCCHRSESSTSLSIHCVEHIHYGGCRRTCFP